MDDPRDRDAALMKRVAAGDRSAGRALVDAHLGPLFGLAHRMLGDNAEAEDVAQEAFLRLWRRADRWEPRARVGTWLHRVAHNLCIDRLRKRGRTVETGPDDEPTDPSPGPAERLARAQAGALVEAAIAALPERQRTALTLVHHGEMSQIEAADVMGIGVEALESLLARARRKLRERLAAHRRDLMEGEP